MEQSRKKKFNLRAFTTSAVGLVFLVMIVSGIVIYITPSGRLAKLTGWTLWGLEKDGWSAIHMNAALLFLMITVLHLYFNWKRFLNYFRSKLKEGQTMKRELFAAFTVAIFIVAGTVLFLPPFDALAESRHAFKGSCSNTSSGCTLALAQQTGNVSGKPSLALASSDCSIAARIACGALEQQTGNVSGKPSLALASSDCSIACGALVQASHNNSCGIPSSASCGTPGIVPACSTPQKLAVPACISEEGDTPSGSHGKGYGKMNVAQICAIQGLETAAALESLRKAGLEASESSNIRELALAIGASTGSLVDYLRKNN